MLENPYFKVEPVALGLIRRELDNKQQSVGEMILQDLMSSGEACYRVVCEQFDDMERLYSNVSGYVLRNGLADRYWCRKTSFDPNVGYSFLVIDLTRADDYTKQKFEQFKAYQDRRTDRPARG